MEWLDQYTNRPLSVKEVTMEDDHKVLIGVDNNIWLIVVDPLGILDNEWRPHPIHLVNIVMPINIVIIKESNDTEPLAGTFINKTVVCLWKIKADLGRTTKYD